MSKFSFHSHVATPLARFRRWIRIPLAALLLAIGAAAQSSVVGAWSPVDWQCDTVSLAMTPPADSRQRMFHGALIPHGPYRGCVLTWGKYEDRTLTFLWDPSSPDRLFHVVNSWGGFPRDVDAIAMTWDDEGQLVLVGPSFPSTGGVLSETWRLFPSALNFPAIQTVPGTPCNASAAEVGGNAWRALSNVSVGRYRPALFTMANGLFASSAVEKSLLLLGGTTMVNFLPVNDGLEFWQALAPRSTPGGSIWSSTFVPNIAHPHTDPSPNETYVVQNGLTETQVEAAPCTLQLGNAGQAPFQFIKSSFMAQDSLVSYATPPSASSHAPGLSTVVRPRYQTTPSSWEYWPRGGGGNFQRSQGSAVLRHDLVGYNLDYTGKNRVISVGGLAYSSTGSGWYTLPAAQEYVIGAGSNPSQGSWTFINLQPVAPFAVGRIDNSAVLLPTGDILVVGGGRIPDNTNLPTGTTADDVSNMAVPVHTPQLVRPGLQGGPTSGVWTVADMATAPVQPGYGVIAPRGHGHSAVLLADGRVLVSGGNTTSLGTPGLAFTGDIYSPAYLFQSFRPSIHNLSGSSFTFGQSITMTAGRQPNEVIDAVVLLRPASTCHGFDSSQRYIELSFTLGAFDADTSTQAVAVTAPTDDLGPAGHYMIFVVSHLSGASAVRVPSIGQFIHLN